MQLPEKLRQKLQEREIQGSLRALKTVTGVIDFCSNDYLGLAHSPVLHAAVERALPKYYNLPWGATGSRLLSGNSALMEETEAQIAIFHQAEAALLFNSGFAANTGFFSSVPQRGDTILYDEASHASIKDGIRLSFAKAYSFRHNSPDDIISKFKFATGQVYVAVESLYSMDGDFAPLTEIAAICTEKGAYLIVDEAHATGLYGPDGAGLVQALELQEKVFARIITFGKALGCHGAAVVGAKDLIKYLINFSRSFIYTTALPLHAVLTISSAYKLLPELQPKRDRVLQLAAYLHGKIQAIPHLPASAAVSPIQGIQPESVALLKKMAATLQAQNFDVRPIFSPTVPTGKERLRVIVHAFNTEAEIDQLTNILAKAG
jgi:8-amino-7-oxononanoate synthase